MTCTPGALAYGGCWVTKMKKMSECPELWKACLAGTLSWLPVEWPIQWHWDVSVCQPACSHCIISLLPIVVTGEVYSWGSGFYGRLGHGNLRDRFSPLMIGAPLRGLAVTYIACHEFHSAAVCGGPTMFVLVLSGVGSVCRQWRAVYMGPSWAIFGV